MQSGAAQDHTESLWQSQRQTPLSPGPSLVPYLLLRSLLDNLGSELYAQLNGCQPRVQGLETNKQTKVNSREKQNVQLHF